MSHGVAATPRRCRRDAVRGPAGRENGEGDAEERDAETARRHDHLNATARGAIERRSVERVAASSSTRRGGRGAPAANPRTIADAHLGRPSATL
mmetsp:Transcript_21284/g.65429  ORF Transcript_21284/g.65429 Transcript_21284/m.65429 type:complete len:94 (+) Transcript_21284:918-1199(+)